MSRSFKLWYSLTYFFLGCLALSVSYEIFAHLHTMKVFSCLLLEDLGKLLPLELASENPWRASRRNGQVQPTWPLTFHLLDLLPLFPPWSEHPLFISCIGISTRIRFNKKNVHLFLFSRSLDCKFLAYRNHLTQVFNWNRSNQIWRGKRGSTQSSPTLYKMYSWASNLGQAPRQGGRLPGGVRSEASVCSRLYRKQQEKHHFTLM